ncbi:ROK family transcriptional regulator [Halanaerobium sp. ST460_2HS_T2]|uniref:ROK family transcriptional regulator n=1 Tax=Halanaerobium sp. ST460_2HS_T2 TaxID=2183914 RepID=UPI000DF4538E|nr:ROK family transcriptional regulator [Halanaerobium sp. ST460_2HS_T2]RCW52280.1 putative NBD/HSP70 family sugar kinase [Halanaerobium sp. ST460_2HS_T2]
MDKEERLKILYKILLENEALTKPELAEKAGLSLTAISDYINELVDSDWILPRKKADSSGGRRAVIYEINAKKRYIIGIDLKDSHFYIFISDLKGEIIKTKIHYLNNCSFNYYINEILKVIRTILAELNLKNEDFLSFGISISGITDFENKIVNRSNQLDWTDQPLAERLEKELEIPVFVETDVRIYAHNELDKDDQNNITTVLFIGEGIGLALIVRNQILQGYTNRVGDNRFFGEKLKNLIYIIRNDQYLKEINKLPYYSKEFEEEKIEELNQRYKEFISKNQKNSKELNDFTDYIASMMLSTINLLNPKKVLLTGNVFDYNDLIYSQVREKISAGEMYHLPEIKRNKKSESPLEKAVLSFLMQKFFAIEKFNLMRE